jgi:hypothetical protein
MLSSCFVRIQSAETAVRARAAVLASLLLLAPTAAHALPIVIDFDELADLEIVGAHYEGLTFEGAIALSAGASLNDFDYPPHSGGNVIAGESGSITVQFATPVVGIGGFFTYAGPLTLTGYDAAHNVVATAVSLFASNLALDVGSAPNEWIFLTAAGGITSVTIAGGGPDVAFTLDDLTVSASVPEPGTLALCLCGVAGLIASRCRFRLSRTGVGIRPLALWGAVAAPLLVPLAAGAAPVIDAVSASPVYVPINRPTLVVVTARIAEPTVIATGVTLLKTDGEGRTLATLGTMRDDGSNGDVIAGDRTFTARTSVNEPAVGVLHFRVSAAFRGVVRRTLSAPIVITLDPIPLPPPPGEAGKLTLQGIDSDADGVRDDVQRYIGLNYLDRPDMRIALQQLTREQQQFLLAGPTASEADLLTIVAQRARAIDCLQFVAGGPRPALTALTETRAVLLDTRARSLAFIAADARLSGRFFPSSEPETLAVSCAAQP